MQKYRWDETAPPSRWQQTDDPDSYWRRKRTTAQEGKRSLQPGDLILGFQERDGVKLPVILKEKFRDRGVLVIGKPGSGKTNLLRNMILQDLEKGNGFAD